MRLRRLVWRDRVRAYYNKGQHSFPGKIVNIPKKDYFDILYDDGDTSVGLHRRWIRPEVTPEQAAINRIATARSSRKHLRVA